MNVNYEVLTNGVVKSLKYQVCSGCSFKTGMTTYI